MGISRQLSTFLNTTALLVGEIDIVELPALPPSAYLSSIRRKHSRTQTYALDKVTSYQKLSFSATCSVRGLFCKPVMTPKLVDPTVTFGSAKIGLFVTLKASPRS